MHRGFDPSSPIAPSAATPNKGGLYRRIAAYLAEFRRGVGGSMALLMASSLFAALQPWPVKFLIDGVLVHNQIDLGPLGVLVAETKAGQLGYAALLAGIYLLIVAAGILLGAAGYYLIARTALEMIHTLRMRLVGHLRGLSLRYHASQAIGDTIWRAINDARSIQEVMIFGIRTWGEVVFRMALMVVLMLLLDPLLTAVAIAVVPLLFLAIHRLTGEIQERSRQSREWMSKLTSRIEQMMGAIRAVQVFGREQTERERLVSVSRSFVHAQLRFRLAEQRLNVTTVVLTGAGTAAVLLVAAERVISGQVTIGTLWIYVSYMQALYQLMNQVMFVYGPFQDAVVGVGRVFDALDERSDIEERPDAQAKPDFTGNLRFDQVTLEYEPGRPTLDNLTFEVRRGQRIAFVGETGSGKTSILNLIPRLLDVTHGKITIDGVDIRDVRLADLRDLMSMVPQEPLLFSATIRENIRYGNITADDEEVVAAAHAACAAAFVERLPNTYDTEIGDRGARLSTGQQLRISIARAFLKDTPILLLDEPTAALDSRTESELLDSIEELMAGRTVLIVAHRLSTIRNSDRIYVIDAGRIAESGTHEQLLAAKGSYYDLWIHQEGRQTT